MASRVGRFLGRNALGVVAIVLALSGTAYANFVVSSNKQIGPNTVAGHHPPSGKHANLIASSVTTEDLAGSSITTGKLAVEAVTGANLAKHAVTSSKLADGAVKGSKLADGAVTAPAIQPGAVGITAIQAGSVGSSAVIDNSLTLSDLVGANVTGSFSTGGVAAHSCTTFTVGVGGAQVGQVVLMSFLSASGVPNVLLFEPMRVSTAGKVALRVCNPTNGNSIPISNAQVRIVTFG